MVSRSCSRVVSECPICARVFHHCFICTSSCLANKLKEQVTTAMNFFNPIFNVPDEFIWWVGGSIRCGSVSNWICFEPEKKLQLNYSIFACRSWKALLLVRLIFLLNFVVSFIDGLINPWWSLLCSNVKYKIRCSLDLVHFLGENHCTSIFSYCCLKVYCSISQIVILLC
jgi:hypothetical protein